jgi:hypothetical protein
MPSVSIDRVTTPLDIDAVMLVDAVTYHLQAVFVFHLHTLYLYGLHPYSTAHQEQKPKGKKDAIQVFHISLC